MKLLKTSLHQKHKNLNAKMVPFAGFDMPIQYSSVKDEVLAVRNNCGVFDVSHMGEFFLRGKQAIACADYLVTNNIQGAAMNKAIYSPMCREDGTIIDDLIMYKLADEEILICVNAANIEKDKEWIQKHIKNFDVQFSDESDHFSLLAVQGPKATEILSTLEIPKQKDIKYYEVVKTEFRGASIILAKTGYTGEDGYEIFSDHKTAIEIWDSLLEKNVVPCGLASRDVLRTEVGFPLYGQDIHDQVNPYDSGLKWTVKLDEREFIGKNALESGDSKYKLVKLILDKGIPRPGYEVLDESGAQVGVVTSGTMSVVLGKGIALAHIERNKKPEKYVVNIRNRHYDAQSVKGSFLKL